MNRTIDRIDDALYRRTANGVTLGRVSTKVSDRLDLDTKLALGRLRTRLPR